MTSTLTNTKVGREERRESPNCVRHNLKCLFLWCIVCHSLGGVVYLFAVTGGPWSQPHPWTRRWLFLWKHPDVAQPRKWFKEGPNRS